MYCVPPTAGRPRILTMERSISGVRNIGEARALLKELGCQEVSYSVHTGALVRTGAILCALSPMTMAQRSQAALYLEPTESFFGGWGEGRNLAWGHSS